MKRTSKLVGLLLVVGALGIALWAMLHTPAVAPPPAMAAPSPAVVAPPVAPDDDLPPLEEVDWPEDAPRTLYGAVTDPDGKPIAGAQVRVRFEARRSDRKVVTDIRGEFRLERVEPDIAMFEVGARGYTADLTERPVLPAEPKVRWDVVLDPARGVFGIVISGNRPAPGAAVTLHHGGGGTLTSTRADDAGRFHLDWARADAGPLIVRAVHGQHGEGQADVGGPGEVTVALAGGGYIEGYVVDQDGQPVDAVNLTATPLIRPTGGPPAQSFNSDTGRFLLGPLAPGTTRIWAAAEGYQPGEISGIEVAAGQTVRGVRIELGRSPTLTGRVTDAGTGQPVEGALVVPAEWQSAALAETVGAYTDEDGRYQLRALPGVRTSVEVTADGYRTVLIGGVEGRSGEAIVRDFSMSSNQGDARPASELTGIGATLSYGGGGVVITDIFDGGPAAGALQVGDVIVSVDGVSVGTFASTGVAQAIRGEVGTDVELMIRRGGAGEPQPVTLTRDQVVIPHARPIL